MSNAHYSTRIPNPNIALLHPGDQLTYRQLVTLLDEDFIEPTNSSRKKQLKDFQSLFSYTKGPGRKFTINEVYPLSSISPPEKPKPKSKQKKEPRKEPDQSPPTLPPEILNPSQYGSIHKGKYYLPFVNILFRYLPQQAGNPMYMIPNHLFSLLGITNSAYSRTSHNDPYPFYRGEGTANPQEVRWFFQKSYVKFMNNVDNLLKGLTTLGVLTVTNGYLLYNTNNGYYPPTKKEAALIAEAEEFALDDLQVDSKSEVLLHRQTKEFYDYVYSQLPSNFRAEKYYSCYIIKIAPDILQQCAPMDEEEYKYWRKKMNDLVIQSFDQTITNFYRKYSEQTEGKSTHYYSKNFVYTERRLMNELLRIGGGKKATVNS